MALSELAALPGAAVLLLGGGGAVEEGATADELDEPVELAAAVSIVDVAVSIDVGTDVRLDLAPPELLTRWRLPSSRKPMRLI